MITNTIKLLIIASIAILCAVAVPSEIEYEEVIDLQIENTYTNELRN
jgi:hypothetical protein